MWPRAIPVKQVTRHLEAQLYEALDTFRRADHYAGESTPIRCGDCHARLGEYTGTTAASSKPVVSDEWAFIHIMRSCLNPFASGR